MTRRDLLSALLTLPLLRLIRWKRESVLIEKRAQPGLSGRLPRYWIADSEIRQMFNSAGDLYVRTDDWLYVLRDGASEFVPA